MLGVEARSSLPHDQHNGGNLPGQGQTRHLRPDALGQQRCVELLKRSGFARGHDRRALKQILQIVIAVSVQSANGDLFLRSFESANRTDTWLVLQMPESGRSFGAHPNLCDYSAELRGPNRV